MPITPETLSTQILEILHEEGYLPTKLAENLIVFKRHNTLYMLTLEIEIEGLIFIQLFARYADDISHLSTEQKFEFFNKINLKIKQVKISIYSQDAKEIIQLATEYWVKNKDEFKILFPRSLSALAAAELHLQNKAFATKFPFL